MSNFQFKQFALCDARSAMKVGTDGVLLGCWAGAEGFSTIIDAGCGCGLIALMMAQRTADAHIIGIDIDAGAVADARDNASASPWAGRVEIVGNDILGWMPVPAHPLLIVSNPPFFTESLRSPSGERALARHGDTFGVRELISWSARLMTGSDDRLAFIAPADRDSEIEYHLAIARLTPLRRCSVSSRQGRQPMRTLWEAGTATTACERTHLDIRDTSNNLTQQYRTLTSAFYLDK